MQLVTQYQVEIVVEKDGVRQDGRSIVGMLMLLAGKGSSITVRCWGCDATRVIDAITALIEDGFGEHA